MPVVERVRVGPERHEQPGDGHPVVRRREQQRSPVVAVADLEVRLCAQRRRVRVAVRRGGRDLLGGRAPYVLGCGGLPEQGRRRAHLFGGFTAGTVADGGDVRRRPVRQLIVSTPLDLPSPRSPTRGSAVQPVVHVPAWHARRVAQQTHRSPRCRALGRRSGSPTDPCLRLRASSTAEVAAGRSLPSTPRPGRRCRPSVGRRVTSRSPTPITDFVGTSFSQPPATPGPRAGCYDQVWACRSPRPRRRRGPARCPRVKAGRHASAGQSRLARRRGAGLRPGSSDRPHGRRRVRLPMCTRERCEKHGRRHPLTRIRDWVGHHHVVIQPVSNMARARCGRLPRPTRMDARPRHAP